MFWGQRLVFIAIAIRIRAFRWAPLAKARFDHTIGDKPDNRKVDDQERNDEPPISGNVCIIVGIQNFARFFGDAVKQGVELTRKEIGGKSARNARKGGGNASQWMATSGGEQHACERDEDNISRVRRVITDHRDQSNHRREQEYRSAAHS